MSPLPLSSLLLRATGREATPADAELEALLGAMLDAARAAWPAVEIEPARFLAYVAERVDPAQPLPAALGALRADDLYLACGCADALPAALRLFEGEILGQVPRAVSTLGLSAALVDEVGQTLRARLLLAEPGAAPRIVEYGGRGSLRGWVRVAAVRAGRDLLRRQTARRTAERAAAADAPPAPRDPEDDHLRGRYQEAFGQALGQALLGLPAEGRELLHLHFREGMRLDQIAARLGVNKSTISRRIAAACDAVMAAAQGEMQAQLGIGEEEFESLAGVLRSQLHLSLSQVLRIPFSGA